MENSKIEWTNHTFNPWIGCTKVSPGCANCYAETLMDTRYGRVKWGKGNPRSRTAKENWRKPVQWNAAARRAQESWDTFRDKLGTTDASLIADGHIPFARPRVFCASLADWLDDEVPVEWLADLLALIHATPNLDWLLLTKRPENWRKRLDHASGCFNDGNNIVRDWLNGESWPNVWIGISAEDQKRWDERMPHLKSIPARVLFVSAEPLLGPVKMNGLTPDWLIVGGESGPGSRTMETEWVKSLRDQAVSRGIAYHFKQWGGTDKKATGRILDGRTWDELPASVNNQPEPTPAESSTETTIC